MMLDTSTPALLLMIGDHTWDYGAVATVRSLGRIGVPVHVALTDPDHPVTASKYVVQTLVWPTTGAESEDDLVARIRGLCQSIGRPAVAIAGDDETAVLLARRRKDLDDLLLLPRVDPDLPGLLATKGSLAQLCARTGTPTPATITPASLDDIRDFLERARFPLVVKNPEPFSRLVNRAIPTTTKVDDPDALFALLRDWRPGTPLLVQEFLPEDVSEDWYVAAVLTDDHQTAAAFSGVKVRAYPTETGVGTLSLSRHDPHLIDLSIRFCLDVGYVGVCDMDWRLDKRDGQYKLLDFNPRRGAQFSTFRSTTGMDVVRALYLVMTGRPVPAGEQIDGIRHVVGVLDHRAYLQRRHRPGEPGPIQTGRVERAWWAVDDPGPALRFAAQLGPWGRLRHHSRSAPVPPATTAWQAAVLPDPAPIPFDKPGPPRPVERWQATMSTDSGQVPVLVAVARGEHATQQVQHECATRDWAATAGVPVPTVLACGADWMISPLVTQLPSEGADYVDEALQCAALIRAADSPPPEAVSVWHGSRRDLPQRLVRAAIGRLPMREFRRVRAEAADLPVDAWIHGDYSLANVMNSPDGIRIIDWEFSGKGVYGTDEIRLWTTLMETADRRRLMTSFLDTLPPQRRAATGVLVHWLALRQLAENLAAPRRYQIEENITLGHVVLQEARAWRQMLSHEPTR